MNTKVRGRDALLAHLRETACTISVSYQGGRRSGYLRHKCEHRVWPRPAVETLRREKLIESYVPEGARHIEWRPLRLKVTDTKETTMKHDDTTKRLAGTVCVLHGTFPRLLTCPICDGYRVNGGEPACECCGAKLKPMRRFAFTAVSHNDRALPGGGGIIVGRADEGTRGYSPLPALGVFETFEEAQKKADELNRVLGLDEKAATLVVVGTMHVRESEMMAVLRRALELMEQARNGTADDDAVMEWADDARRIAQV